MSDLFLSIIVGVPLSLFIFGVTWLMAWLFAKANETEND